MISWTDVIRSIELMYSMTNAMVCFFTLQHVHWVHTAHWRPSMAQPAYVIRKLRYPNNWGTCLWNSVMLCSVLYVVILWFPGTFTSYRLDAKITRVEGLMFGRMLAEGNRCFVQLDHTVQPALKKFLAAMGNNELCPSLKLYSFEFTNRFWSYYTLS